MKQLFFIMSIFSFFFAKSVAQEQKTIPPVSFYNLHFRSIAGEDVSFEILKGKYVLLVNTASKCGFTPQFEELEKLSQNYKDKLVVIGFPSNNFGSQDPGTNEEISSFCQLNYGVTFLMMEKSNVKGDAKNEVFEWLTDKTKNGWNETEPSWNFCKYLVDKDGNLLAFFPSKVKPLSDEIVDKLK